MSDSQLSQLHRAIVKRDNETALKLIAKPNMEKYLNKKIGMGTCLTLSCMNNNIEVCQALLDRGADPEICESYGGTALHIASDKGHLECVKLLVQSGAKVEQKCQNNYTALDLAKLNGNQAVVDYLKSLGQGQTRSTEDSGASNMFYAGKTGTDEVDANLTGRNAGQSVYGMGYQYIDARMAEMKEETDDKITEVRDETRAGQNHLRNEIVDMQERIHKLEISQETRGRHKRQVSRDDSLKGEAKEMAERVRSNFCLFADSIVASEIMYALYEKRALNDDDLDEIDNIAASRQKSIKLIRILLAKKDSSWVYALRDTLEEQETDFMRNLARIMDSEYTSL